MANRGTTLGGVKGRVKGGVKAKVRGGEVRIAKNEAHAVLRQKVGSKQMKTFRLSESKIRRARKILGTSTDTGTIEAALDLVVFRKELVDGLAAMAGTSIVAPEAMDAPGA